jgi:hypothetical protein
MFTATLLTWVLAAAPQASTPTDKAPPREIERVDLERSDDTVQITARDSDGEVSAEMFLWRDSDGNARLDATWPDGLYLSVISDGENATIETENAAEAGSRLDRLDAAIQETAAGNDWQDCAIHLGLAAPACAAHPILCAYEMYYAACACLPLLDEFEGEEC